MDESIKSVSGRLAAMRNEYYKEETAAVADNPANNINWGFVVIAYDKVWLDKRPVWDGRKVMVLPRDFAKGDTDLFENEDKDISFAFSVDEFGEDSLARKRERRMEVCERDYGDVEELTWKGSTVLTYSYEQEEEDGRYYYYQFLTELEDDQLGEGTFRCRIEYKSDWILVVKQCCLVIANPEEAEEENHENG